LSLDDERGAVANGATGIGRLDPRGRTTAT